MNSALKASSSSTQRCCYSIAHSSSRRAVRGSVGCSGLPGPVVGRPTHLLLATPLPPSSLPSSIWSAQLPAAFTSRPLLSRSIVAGGLCTAATKPQQAAAAAAAAAPPAAAGSTPAAASPKQQPSKDSSNNNTNNKHIKKMSKDLMAPASLRTTLTELFRTALQTAYPNLTGEEPVIAACNNPKFGDYQCNNAMQLFGKLKGTEGAPKAPRDVANALLAALPANDVIVETSLAGPGFINLKLSRPWLAKRVSGMLTDGLQPLAPNLRSKRCIVDFSSPNVAKEMHVGHLRSTIIGDTLCRTLEFCGADVLRLNHIGDWGTQFGMLIQHMSELRPEGLGAEGGKDEDVADLMELYRAAKKRFDAEEDFKTRAREMVTQLQGGEPAVTRAWQRICEASRKEFQAIYDRLGVKLQERGESFYNPLLKEIVEELQTKGVSEVSEGAVCVFVAGHQIPLIVQKSDGGFGYASTDMAAVKQRVSQEKADWIIYVTDSGQAQHFEMVFAAAKKAGWLDGMDGRAAPKIDHVGFGLVLGEDGKKFKTRSGDVVRLVELLDEAKARCTATIRERWAESGAAVDEAELDAASSAMGYGAVKYADLKNHRLTNYKFSYDAMLDLKGNTAVYLLYAHARIAGIVRKAGQDVDVLARDTPLVLSHPREEELAQHLAKFSEALEDLLAELAPNRLTDYLYELSEKFNQFYVDCKVIGSENEASRLLLCEATARVMRQCFALLGITPLYRI